MRLNVGHSSEKCQQVSELRKRDRESMPYRLIAIADPSNSAKSVCVGVGGNNAGQWPDELDCSRIRDVCRTKMMPISHKTQSGYRRPHR